MQKLFAFLVALIVGTSVSACDRSITLNEGGHTAGSGNMRSAAAPRWDASADTTTRSGHTVGSGN